MSDAEFEKDLDYKEVEKEIKKEQLKEKIAFEVM